MTTKQKIIQVVGELFAEKGYMLSMSDISERVGIKVPSIYSHFESKDQIVYLAIEENLTDFNIFLKELYSKLQNESTECILRGIYFGVIDYYSSYTKLKLYRNIDFIPDGLLYEKCKKLQKEYSKEQMSILDRIFEEGYKKGEVKFRAEEGYQYLYLTMLRGILDGMITYSDEVEVRKVYEKKIWKIFWNSIKESGEQV